MHARRLAPLWSLLCVGATSAAALGIEVSEGIVYATHGGEELQLDIAFPKDAATGSAERALRRRPAILFIHGGAWRSGSRRTYAGTIRRAAERGYVAATVSYRLAPKHSWPAQWEDVRAAVLWLRRHADEYRLDPSRIGVTGDSAGGHLSLMLGTYPDGEKGEEARVQAVVNYYGPADLRTDHYEDWVKQVIRDLVAACASSSATRTPVSSITCTSVSAPTRMPTRSFW